MKSLEKLRSELMQDEAVTGISQIAEKYLHLVNGGSGTTFLQFTQNSGEPGPHSGPFWQQVTRPTMTFSGATLD